MSKMSLTEATMLALQGKLNLTEDVEIETNDAQVTVTPDKTIINNAEATVTVEQPEDVVVTDTVTEPEEVLPVEDTENIDTMVDDKPVESEVEDTVEEITESKKLQEDDESDEDEESEESEETTEEESEVEEEPETTEEVPVEDQLTAIDDAVAKIRDMINTLPEEVKSEIFKCEDCEEVPVESEETTEEESEVEEEPIDELEECDKFNSKTFNEVFTKYYKKYNKKVEKFELTKLLKNKNTLKVEGRLFNTDSTTKELKLEMKQVQRGTKFARYELKTDKKVESVRGKQIMMVSAADKVLNCNYMINKK